MPKNNDHENFQLFTFANGLRLITIPMEHTDSVTVLVMVGTGSRYEAPANNGVSHFLEHMMFKGTVKRPGSSDITHELDSIGADYNAFTSKEYTGYYVKCSSEKIDTALDVISDIFQNSKFETAEIEKEKGVIVEEINMYLDTPSRYVNDIFEKLLYDGQPLGFMITGDKDVIRKFDKKVFEEYFSSHYFDKNTVIAIAGNIDKEAIREKVSKYFSNIRSGSKLDYTVAKDIQAEPKLDIFYKKTDQSHFNLGFRALNYFSDKKPVLDAMSLILSGGMSSRLFEEFREKRGMAYYVSSFNNPYADVGYFAIRAGVDNNRLYEALETALAQCRKLINEDVSEEELKKIKDYAHGKLAIGLETSDDLASFYADQELLKRELLTPQQELDLLNKVSIQDIRQMAAEIFDPKNLNLALIGPFQQDDAKINEILKSW